MARNGIESRRNREMVKKQARTMATAEMIASSGDWYIFVCQMQKYGYRKTAACMLCQCQKAHKECGSSWNGKLPKEKSATFRAQGALDKRRLSQPRTMRESGSCYKKPMCMGRRIDT